MYQVLLICVAATIMAIAPTSVYRWWYRDCDCPAPLSLPPAEIGSVCSTVIGVVGVVVDDDSNVPDPADVVGAGLDVEEDDLGTEDEVRIDAVVMRSYSVCGSTYIVIDSSVFMYSLMSFSYSTAVSGSRHFILKVCTSSSSNSYPSFS